MEPDARGGNKPSRTGEEKHVPPSQEKAQREREKKGGKKSPLFVVSPGERPSDGFEVAQGIVSAVRKHRQVL